MRAMVRWILSSKTTSTQPIRKSTTMKTLTKQASRTVLRWYQVVNSRQDLIDHHVEKLWDAARELVLNEDRVVRVVVVYPSKCVCGARELQQRLVSSHRSQSISASKRTSPIPSLADSSLSGRRRTSSTMSTPFTTTSHWSSKAILNTPP